MGVALGLAAWGAFYFFFLSHRELGVRPGSAIWMGVLGFALGGVGNLVYSAVNTRR